MRCQGLTKCAEITNGKLHKDSKSQFTGDILWEGLLRKKVTETEIVITSTRTEMMITVSLLFIPVFILVGAPWHRGYVRSNNLIVECTTLLSSPIHQSSYIHVYALSYE